MASPIAFLQLSFILAAAFQLLIWSKSAAFLKTISSNLSIPGGVTGDFFRGSLRQNHVPWFRLSLWKWVPWISPGVKAAGAYGWRPTTLVVPNVKKIRDLKLPGTPWTTSGCYGMTFTFISFNLPLRLSHRPSPAEISHQYFLGIWGSTVQITCPADCSFLKREKVECQIIIQDVDILIGK